MITQAPPTAAVDGLVIVDKPAGLTSHDVVARLRRILRTRRVGHAGTLDPMATGVLVVGVNQATRLLHHLVLADKAYTATIRLGVSTVTDDAEGAVIASASAAAVTEAAVSAVLPAFTGAIEQVPSAVSAIKVDGRRAYDRVRAGETVVLAARPVTVERFTVVRFRRPTPDLVELDVEVDCSSGTYVRALARDLGAALAVGGHLTALRRTHVGPFGLDGARSLEQLAATPEPVRLTLPDAMRVAFPVRQISLKEADSLSYGQFLTPQGRAGTYGAIDETGRAVALLRDDDRHARPVLVFIGRG